MPRNLQVFPPVPSPGVVLDPGAFKVRGAVGSLVGLSVEASVEDGRTVTMVTFAWAASGGGSLADGNYALTVRADRVRDL